MNAKHLAARLRTLGVVPEENLAELERVRPGASVKAEAELAATFDVLDRLPDHTGTVVAAMGLVVDALAEVRAPVRAPLGSFSRGLPRQEAAASGSLRVSPKVVTASAQVIGDRDGYVEHVTAALNTIRFRPGFGQVSVLSARWGDDYPDERTLTGDPWLNEAKMAAAARPDAIAAAGGICAPTDVDFSVMTYASDARPLTAGLPSFKAARGGVQYVKSPTLASVGSAATTVWTHAQDAATPYPAADGSLPAGMTVKPVQRIDCPTTSEVLVDAIPTRLQVGNMIGQFSPEWVAAFTDTVMANAAVVAERYVLNSVSSLATTVSSGQLLGAARDLLATLDQVVAAYRFRNRLDDGTRLTVLLPRWVIQMLRADLTRELAHGDDAGALNLSDDEVVALIKTRGVDPILLWEGLDGSAGPVPFAAQGFAAQGQGALIDWPRQLVWQVFTTGTVVHLDGGVLDLSVIRSPELNAINAFETMTETFEGVLYRGGPEVLQVVSTLRPNGGSAGTIATATY